MFPLELCCRETSAESQQHAVRPQSYHCDVWPRHVPASVWKSIPRACVPFLSGPPQCRWKLQVFVGRALDCHVLSLLWKCSSPNVASFLPRGVTRHGAKAGEGASPAAVPTQLMLIEPIMAALKVCHLFENARRCFDNVSVYH